MLKKLLITTAMTAVLVAQTPKDVEVVDVKKMIQEYILKADKEEDIKITQRKQTSDGESFIATVVEVKDDNRSKDIEDNELAGLSFANDVKYTKDSFSATSTLVALPDDNSDLTNEEKEIAKKLIDDKIIVLYSDYNTKNYLYNLSLKDIKLKVEKADIETKSIKMNGYYNINDTVKQSADFSIDAINIIPFSPKLIGEYVKIQNLKITSNTEIDDNKLNINYLMSLGLLDANITKKHSKVEKSNLSFRLGNLNLDAYKALQEFGKNNVSAEIDTDKLQELSIKLLTSKGIYAEIIDLSIGSLLIEDIPAGSAKITAKVTLEENKDLANLIATNPLMVLSSLNVDARIELSKEMLSTLMKDKRAGMLAMLPSKEENGKIIYDIKYSKSELTINGQKL